MVRLLFLFTNCIFFITDKMSRKNKKRKTEEQKINDGEQDNFFSDEVKEEMEMMWEVIGIMIHNLVN